MKMETIKKAGDALRIAASETTYKHVTIQDLAVGEMFAQGDIGILRIDSLPTGAKECERPRGGQVAPGTSKGSRHCVEGLGKFYSFQGDPLSDTCFEAVETWTLVHPEHGHVTCSPGLYQFVHQQNARRERVID